VGHEPIDVPARHSRTLIQAASRGDEPAIEGGAPPVLQYDHCIAWKLAPNTSVKLETYSIVRLWLAGLATRQGMREGGLRWLPIPPAFGSSAKGHALALAFVVASPRQANKRQPLRVSTIHNGN
jgi:hypothetical protein